MTETEQLKTDTALAKAEASRLSVENEKLRAALAEAEAEGMAKAAEIVRSFSIEDRKNPGPVRAHDEGRFSAFDDAEEVIRKAIPR